MRLRLNRNRNCKKTCIKGISKCISAMCKIFSFEECRYTWVFILQLTELLFNLTVISLFIIKFYLMYHGLYLHTYQKVMLVYASIYFSVLPFIAIAATVIADEPIFYNKYDANLKKKCIGRIVHMILTPPLFLLRM